MGGTGAGKSWLGPRWVYRKLIDKPESRALCIGLGYEKHVQRVMMYELKKFFNEIHEPFAVAEKKGEITLLRNGSQCIFGSCENPDCFDSQTEILTDKGWVNGLDLTKDHLVAQSTPEGDVSFVKPTALIQQDYVGPMVELRGRSISMVVTPNHRLPVFSVDGQHRMVRGQYRMVRAQDFEPTERLAFRKAFSLAEGGDPGVAWLDSPESPADAWGVADHKEIVPYDGKIWCVSVPETYVVVRRNGIAHLSGNSLEGAHIEAVWIDEAGLMPKHTWDVAQRRCAYTKGQILITTVPYFLGWLHDEVYQGWLDGDPAITWVGSKSADNPDYPREEIERQRRRMRADKFAIFHEGEFAKPYGLVFGDPSNEEIVVDPQTEFQWNLGCGDCLNEVHRGLIPEPLCKGMIPCDWPAFSGHDYGMNAPTTGVWGRLSPDDVLYIVHDYEQNEMTIESHIEVWDEMDLLGIDEGWGDPANPEVWMRAMELDVPIVSGNNNISAGIDAVEDRLLTGRLKVFRGCGTWLDHRQKYVWASSPNDEDVLLDRPKKPQPAEHMMDATRYLCMGIAERGLGVASPAVMARRRSLVGR